MIRSLMFFTVVSPEDATWVFLLSWFVSYFVLMRSIRIGLLNLGKLKILPLEERTLPELVQRIGQCSLFPPGLFRAPNYTKDSSNESFGRDLANWFFHVKELCWLKKDKVGKAFLAGRVIHHIMLYLYPPFLVLFIFHITLPMRYLTGTALLASEISMLLSLLLFLIEKKYATSDVVYEEWLRTPKKKRKRPAQRRKHGRGK